MAGSFPPDFLSVVDQRLVELGLRRPRKRFDIWVQPVVPGVSAWVGVVPRSYGDSLGVLVTVGARHETIEQALRQLWPELIDSTNATNVNATIATNVQELLPQPVRGSIYVDGPEFIEPAAATVAERVRDHGLPFARSVVTLPALIEAWRQHARPTTAYRRPIALYLNGEPDRAREDLDATLERFDKIEGVVKEDFNRFARDFFTRMATLPAPAE